MEDKIYNEEEVQALILVEKYKYYKNYVEGLEKELEEAFDEITNLKEKLRLERMQTSRLKNKNDDLKSKLNGKDCDSDAQRYREMCVRLSREKKQLLAQLERLRK